MEAAHEPRRIRRHSYFPGTRRTAGGFSERRLIFAPRISVLAVALMILPRRIPETGVKGPRTSFAVFVAVPRITWLKTGRTRSAGAIRRKKRGEGLLIKGGERAKSPPRAFLARVTAVTRFSVTRVTRGYRCRRSPTYTRHIHAMHIMMVVRAHIAMRARHVRGSGTYVHM